MAFILNWLTIEGVSASILFGLIAFGFGGIVGAVIALAFFISSSLISKDLISEENLLSRKFRRDGIQVWSNGFWFSLWIIVWFLSKVDAFLVAAVASMASATADTWASEIGEHHVKGKTWLITTLNYVKPGTDGGISFIGTLASLIGAFFIGGIFWMMSPTASIISFLLISVSGFLGSVTDSWFGAKIQGSELHNSIKKLFGQRLSYVDNNIVNWMAAGSASIVALVTTFIFGQ